VRKGTLPDPPTPEFEPDAGPGREPGPAADALLRVVRGLETELAQLRRELAWSQRLATLGTLAAAVAHEVNNALTPVGAYAQLALDSAEDAELARKALLAAVDGVERASRIADSVLGLAREDPGGGAGGQRCPLREAVDSAVSCLAMGSRHERIDVRVSVPEVDVAMARGELQQVLVNLLSNARKALLGRATVGRVSITTEQPSARQGGSAAGHIVLVVADNGPGIPEPVRERLFDAFVTHPSGQTMRHKEQGSDAPPPGTGLGLSISRDLVERAGGQITAENAAGGGAVFRIELPVIRG
jgi:signal transduction histidine kinase